MIEDNEYKFPHEEPQKTKSQAELEASRKLEEELNALDFRPHGIEW